MLACMSPLMFTNHRQPLVFGRVVCSKGYIIKNYQLHVPIKNIFKNLIFASIPRNTTLINKHKVVLSTTEASPS